VKGGLYGYDIPIPQGKIYPEKTEVRVYIERMRAYKGAQIPRSETQDV
jgi:hypothetical protein